MIDNSIYPLRKTDFFSKVYTILIEKISELNHLSNYTKKSTENIVSSGERKQKRLLK